MFLKKIESSKLQTIDFETDVSNVDFTIDNIKDFFSKRKLPLSDTDICRIEGKLKWQVSIGDDFRYISISVPDGQKFAMHVSYYVDDESDATKDIKESVTLKNIKVEVEGHRRGLSSERNKLFIKLHIEDIYWDEEGTLIKFTAG